MRIHAQLEAEDFARRWQMLGNASKEEAGEVWAGAPVTAERWAAVRGLVTSAIKMGEAQWKQVIPGDF